MVKSIQTSIVMNWLVFDERMNVCYVCHFDLKDAQTSGRPFKSSINGLMNVLGLCLMLRSALLSGRGTRSHLSDWAPKSAHSRLKTRSKWALTKSSATSSSFSVHPVTFLPFWWTQSQILWNSLSDQRSVCLFKSCLDFQQHSPAKSRNSVLPVSDVCASNQSVDVSDVTFVKLFLQESDKLSKLVIINDNRLTVESSSYRGFVGAWWGLEQVLRVFAVLLAIGGNQRFDRIDDHRSRLLWQVVQTLAVVVFDSLN